jgi:hypothetical protein
MDWLIREDWLAGGSGLPAELALRLAKQAGTTLGCARKAAAIRTRVQGKRILK